MPAKPSAYVVKLRGDVDGCCAVDRLGRVVGADRAVVAEEGAVASGRTQPSSGPADALRDLVCVAHRDRLAAPAARAWLRLWGDVLAAAGCVAASGGVGAAAWAAAGAASRCRADRVDAGGC